MSEALDEELDRLPTRYRVPIILCHLEGLTYQEAALRLGCPVGTIGVWLSRGREVLRARLARRGVASPASAIALSGGVVQAAVPEPLVLAAVRTALLGAAARLSGPASFHIFSLARQESRSMIMDKAVAAAAVISTMVTVAASLGLDRGSGTVGKANSGVQAIGANARGGHEGRERFGADRRGYRPRDHHRRPRDGEVGDAA